MTIKNDITELGDRIEHIEDNYKPIGLVTGYVKHLKKDLKKIISRTKKDGILQSM